MSLSSRMRGHGLCLLMVLRACAFQPPAHTSRTQLRHHAPQAMLGGAATVETWLEDDESGSVCEGLGAVLLAIMGGCKEGEQSLVYI